MSRLMLKALAPLLVLLTLMVSGIHAFAFDQPYFDGLRAFLLPPDHCPAPCFLGIRPGVTTRNEALALLQSQPSVKYVRDNGATISWEWVPGAAYVKTAASATYNAWLAVDQNHVVRSITVDGTAELGDVWIALGKPDREQIAAVYQQVAYPSYILIVHTTAYDAPQLALVTHQSCPVLDLWSAPVRLMWGTALAEVGHDGKYPFPANLPKLNREWGC
jgi:hypothetical protein